MGMFDTVTIKCPKCGTEYDAQTKGGDCVLMEYELPVTGAMKPAPMDVMSDINRHAPFQCRNKDCGCTFAVKLVSQPVYEVVEVDPNMVLPDRPNIGHFFTSPLAGEELQPGEESW